MRRTVALAVVLSFCAAAPARADIRVLSNRADLISGGDALVQVTPAGGKVSGDRRDVTPQLAVPPDGRCVARVSGLRDGGTVVVDGEQERPIGNHALGGRALAGPEIQPGECAEGPLDAEWRRMPK